MNLGHNYIDNRARFCYAAQARYAMLFKLDCDWSPKNRVMKHANNFADAATIFAFEVYGKGYGSVKVCESPTEKSAIVISPGRRPFKIEVAK